MEFSGRNRLSDLMNGLLQLMEKLIQIRMRKPERHIIIRSMRPEEQRMSGITEISRRR